jgi:hypothetical protein
MLIEEMLQPSELDRLLRDSFANYVIQTALDYANPAMKNRLIEAIRPYLPAIRTTPYGRRIQAKIQGNEGRSGPSSGEVTPNELGSSQIPVRHQRGMSNASAGSYVSPVGPFTNGFTASPTSGLPIPSSRPAAQPGGFPSSASLTSNQAPQPSFPYSYGRGNGGNGQAGANNWL